MKQSSTVTQNCLFLCIPNNDIFQLAKVKYIITIATTVHVHTKCKAQLKIYL